MRATRLATAVLLGLLSATGCITLPTGNKGGGGGGGGNNNQQQCTATTFLTDDFSAGLSKWSVTSGTPAISSTVGDPAPSVSMVNAGLISNATFQTTASCGLTVSVAVRLDTGLAIIKAVVPGVQRAAQAVVYDSVVVYYLCQSTGSCTTQAQAVAKDTAWHVYQFRANNDSATVTWTRDGTVAASAGNIVSTYSGLALRLWVLPTDSLGTGPSRGYLDNVLVTSP